MAVSRRTVMHRYGGIRRSGFALAAEVSPPFAWMTPVILAALDPPRNERKHRRSRLRRIGLLVVPEETRAPDILTRANELVATFARAEPTTTALVRLFADPALAEAHRALLPAVQTRKRGDVDVALVVALAKLDDCATLAEAEEVLTRAEKMAVLSDPRGLSPCDGG